jgi:S-adenosylmethionine decarboxylase
MSKKIKLENFNNLNKNLNFSFYDVHYVETAKDKIAVNEYIHKNYNAKKLTEILRTITKKIGANVLNISKQDYDPIAASVNFLITEAPMDPKIVDKSCNLGHLSNRTCKLAHLDKSHIAVHTYPEFSKKSNISTFRIDINVSTCGLISPLHCLNYLLDEFSVKTYTDVVYIDYFVRGFTRTASDKKIFIDHKPAPISNFINREFKKEYHIVEDDFPKFNI